MNRALSAGAMVAVGFALFAGAAAGQERPREVRDRDGRVLKTIGEDGRPLGTCAPSGQNAGPGYVVRENRGQAFTVDACGRIRNDSGEWLGATGDRRQPASQVTIDRMTTQVSYGSHVPGGEITLLGSANVYELNNGSQWSSGAGTYYEHAARLDHVEVSGTTIRYVLAAPIAGLLYEQTDYDAGEHSAQGKLGPSGALVIEAEWGSTTAILRGNTLVASNDATWYGEPRFNYYTAIVGSVVPFELVYTMVGDSWAPDAFSRSFTYSSAGSVDFAHAISTPRAVELKISGPSRIPDESTTSFGAVVRYESGVLRNVSDTASWTVEPTSLASVVRGVLTVGTLHTPQEVLTLRARYVEGTASLAADKQVLCLADDQAERPDRWPMFQANARHTGYLPIALDPATFSLRWQRNVGGGLELNPAAAGEGKVFVSLVTYFSDVTSLFALRALDGETLWSKGFGSIFSVNPPSYAYGNVYIQTGNHATDTWLHAFEGATGTEVFKTPHEAQWERYYAPTIYDGKVYVDGGYYGGMYGFDAYAGTSLWFASLPQYDQWTPAVYGGTASSYLGEYQPGLYARDRLTGMATLFVPDPNFEWNGWSMNLAPVIGTHDDAIAIHDGRLISFNTTGSSIRWEIQSQFTGQPSLARDHIYAVDGGRLVVLDEVTHGQLWSWQAPDGALVGPMIVTNTHLFASTAQSVHAVDLVTRQSVWSYPAAGHLAMADGTLYIASATGTLTAITTSPVVPAPLVALEIQGPAQVFESSSASFHALAHYGDGSVVERTLFSDWSVAPDRFATITGPGELTTRELIQPFHDVVVKARYTEVDHSVEGVLAVRLVIDVTPRQLVVRNLKTTIAIKGIILRELDMALEREQASLAVIRDLPPTPWTIRARALVSQAICLQGTARSEIAWSIYDLTRALGGGKASEPPPPAPPTCSGMVIPDP